MVEIHSNLFVIKKCTLVHCVSADFAMGRGISLEFSKRFGQVDFLKKQNKKVGELAYLSASTNNNKDLTCYYIYLVTKERYFHKPTLQNFQECLNSLKKFCQEKNIEKLAMPRIGCGLDKLSWSVVKSMILKTFKNVNVEIIVCNYSV